MMTITLMRHGKSAHPNGGRCTAREMVAWCIAYDRAGICDTPPPHSLQQAQQATLVVSSPLPRARASLKALGRQAHEVATLYREAELPGLALRFPPLPPALWLVVLRLLWLCGYSGQAEPYRAARVRAARAADKLIELAQQGEVLLLGHGVINTLIARELRKRGWQGEKRASRRHWGSTVFQQIPSRC